jgi:hypothetical protein
MAKKREPKPSEQAQKTIDNTIRRDKLKKKIIKQISNNKKAKKFFEQYNPISIKSFIESYAGRKVNWLEWGPNRVQKEINEKLRFKEAASALIWEIQQKKLFNLQCHWRAGEIELPGIEVSWDFLRWEQKIKTCPFIDTITPEEFDLYKKYMTSGSYQPRHFMSSWQGYDFYRAEYLNDGESMMPTPAWYIYYDTMMGTGNLFMLANYKGDKEQLYLGLVKKREEEKAKKSKKKKGAKSEIPAIVKAISPNFDGKPPIICDYKTKEEFIKKFEDKTILKYFHAMEKEDDNWQEEQALDDCLELFSYDINEDEEKIEFKNLEDLKDSMFRAASDFELAQIVKHLDSAYDEYQLKVNTGISFSENEDLLEFADNAFNSIINFIKEQILDGRELNGEPRDFNY